MSRFVVSAEAQVDIDLIAAYTTDTWSWQQTDRYLSKLEDSFQLLAENPRMGRSCDAISAGLHRHEVGKHVIFYRLKPSGIRVVRILHQQMNPTKSRFNKL
jgi:toxin ParE1/3/4